MVEILERFKLGLLLVWWCRACDIVVVVEDDRRRPGFSSEPLDTEYDNNRTEQ